MKNLPLSSWPQVAVIELEDFITKEVNKKEVKQFLIGTSDDVILDNEKIQCYKITRLYQSQFEDYVEEVKRRLYNSFQYHKKYANRNIIENKKGIEKTLFVYIAIWM